MIQFLGLDDNKKVGTVFLLVAGFLYIFGIAFFFVKTFFMLSNIFFLVGLYFFIGITGVVKFFTKRGKIKGSIVYIGGLILIIINWIFLGAIAQLIGFLLIFRTFLPDLYEYICSAPLIGGYMKSYRLQNALDRLAGNTHNRI